MSSDRTEGLTSADEPTVPGTPTAGSTTATAPGATAPASGGAATGTATGTAGPPAELSAARRRAARVAVCAVFFLTGANFASWAARVPAVRDNLELSAGGLTIALVGLTTGAFIALPPVGGLVARFGSRNVLLVAAAVYLAALPTIAVAPTLGVLVAVLAVFASGNTAVDVAMNTQGVLVERAYGRAILGGCHAMFSLGAIAGAAAGAVAASAGVGVLPHFLAVALVLGITCAVAGCFLLPDPPESGSSGPLLALPGKGLWIPGLIAFCALMGEGVMNDWGAVYLHDVTGSSAGTAAVGFGVFSGGMVVGRLAADRVRARSGTVRFVLGCALVSVAGSALTVAVPTVSVALAGYGLLGLGMAAVIPVVFSHAAARNPDRPGPSIAAVSAVGYVGFLAGPLAVGGVAQAGGLRVALLVLVVLMVTMAALARRL